MRAVLTRLRPRRSPRIARIGACIPRALLLPGTPAGHPDRERDRLDDLGMARAPLSGRDARSWHRRVAIPAVSCRRAPGSRIVELVSAHTGDQALAPDIAVEDLTDDAQNLIADAVSMDSR